MGGESSGMSSMSMGCGNMSCASTLAFLHENMVMHHGMAIEFTCDVEVDFVRGMIPHHAGAVKMCDILRGSVGVETDSDGSGMGMMHSGRMQMPAAIDPFLEGLCSDIEETQAREIAEMEAWLASRSLGAYTSCGDGHGGGMDGHDMGSGDMDMGGDMPGHDMGGGSMGGDMPGHDMGGGSMGGDMPGHDMGSGDMDMGGDMPGHGMGGGSMGGEMPGHGM